MDNDKDNDSINEELNVLNDVNDEDYNNVDGQNESDIDDDLSETSDFQETNNVMDDDDDVSVNSMASDDQYYDLSQNIIDGVDGVNGVNGVDDGEVDDGELDNDNDENNDNLYVDDENEDDDDDSFSEMEYKKLDSVEIEDYTKVYHNDIYEHNSHEVQTLAKVIRDENNTIIDDLHKTIPILTKYERARILGQRAKQINSGAPSFVTPSRDTMDGYLIAIQELEEKKIPFIIRRPLPFGGCEYWRVSDLEIL